MMTGPKNILVATDFSPASDYAVAYAFEMAKQLDARLCLLHVCEPPAVVPEPAGLEVPAVDQLEREADARLRSLMDEHRARPERVETMVAVGDPREEILRATTRVPVDLLLVGTHGRRGVRHMILGSVAEDVLRKASCPVLVVRRTEASHVSA